MDKETKDDLETVRILVEALTPFDQKDRERIVRWAFEKLGFPLAGDPKPSFKESPLVQVPAQGDKVANIKSFFAEKAPKNDNQFCAVVAFYYRFEAPQDQRKEFITAEDLQDAARKVNRDRFIRPAQTLVNAFQGGYFDKAEYGKYRLNAVGENLVAMVLPGGDGAGKSAKPRKKSRLKGKARR